MLSLIQNIEIKNFKSVKKVKLVDCRRINLLIGKPNVVQSILSSTNNSFFITTHSPYIINALLEQLTDEVAIYFVDMKSGNTVVQRATDDEMQEIYESGYND